MCTKPFICYSFFQIASPNPRICWVKKLWYEMLTFTCVGAGIPTYSIWFHELPPTHCTTPLHCSTGSGGFPKLPFVSKDELSSQQPGSNRWSMASHVPRPLLLHWLRFGKMACVAARLRCFTVWSVKVEGWCPDPGIRMSFEIFSWTAESSKRFPLQYKATQFLKCR